MKSPSLLIQYHLFISITHRVVHRAIDLVYGDEREKSRRLFVMDNGPLQQSKVASNILKDIEAVL